VQPERIVNGDPADVPAPVLLALLMGTASFQDAETMVGGRPGFGYADLITVALRRVGRFSRGDDMLGPLRRLRGLP